MTIREPNSEQSAAWNGREGRHWADHAPRYDAVNSGYNELLLEAAGIDRGTANAVDIGCGTGQLTRLAAKRAERGEVLGIDLSAWMLERARAVAAAEGVGNVRFHEGDAQSHSFDPGLFDVAISRFGVMFFDDPVAAFRNVEASLKPGGRLAFVCLRSMEEQEVTSVLSIVEDRASTTIAGGSGESGPFSLADPTRIRELLTAAGFAAIRIDAVDAPQIWGCDAADAMTFMSAWAPVRVHLDPLPHRVRTRLLEDLRRALERYDVGGEVRLQSAAWLVSAIRPDDA